ncbi:unnamed protein product, partial [Effrenium voratum]
MNDLPRGMGLDPILVRQPDGSLAEGRPAGLADSPVLATPPTPPRGFLAAELAEQAMQGSRRVLICILLSSFFVEIALAGERPSVPPTKWHARRAMLALQLNIAYGERCTMRWAFRPFTTAGPGSFFASTAKAFGRPRTSSSWSGCCGAWPTRRFSGRRCSRCWRCWRATPG